MNLSIQNARINAVCQPERPTLGHRISTLLAVARQRRELASLDAHMLQDIGVTPSQAVAESRKAPWNAPYHWR